MLLLCFHIMDSLLNGRFWSYGIDVNNYYGSKPTDEALISNPDLAKPNPMCNLFPTESLLCNLCAGSIGGRMQKTSPAFCVLLFKTTSSINTSSSSSGSGGCSSSSSPSLDLIYRVCSDVHACCKQGCIPKLLNTPWS
eukprot:TRINITY_DN3685_c0_g1_i1.p1 TRINITY_DN3685_c0_g1~~TRINITY_DN3685_c0_g1_i1.p1  ORF type:complete len:138 (+),score=24.00 TRINITY_DN3685_c0_g1_i1:646-1059(+)